MSSGRPSVRLLTQGDVERLLDLPSCIDGVERAFRFRGQGHPSPSAVLGVHVGDGGFHAKAAFLELSRPYFVVKVNANFPGNPRVHGLPTIQGVLLLFDAERGVPLAIMDSMSITILRTAAASAVAAKYLARNDARIAAIIGCGAQAHAHIAAISAVRALERVFVFDIDATKARALSDSLTRSHSFAISVARSVSDATLSSSIIVTTTPSKKAILSSEHVAPGTFIAAVGADNEHKQELDIDLLKKSVIVVDDLDQCATIGDLHHAIAAGVLSRDNVAATLAEIVAGSKVARRHDDDIVVFDSTGVAIEDVAAAAIVFERAEAEGDGASIALGS